MFETLRELVRFYAQRFHVPIDLVHQDWEIAGWNEQSVLVGMPDSADRELMLDESRLGYSPAFGSHLPGEEVFIRDVPIARVNEKAFLLLFLPQNQLAEALLRQLVEQHLSRLARNFRRNQLKHFKERIAAHAKDRQEKLESTIWSDQYEMDNLTDKMRSLATRIANNRQLLNFFKTSEDVLRRRAARLFVELMKLVPVLYSRFIVDEQNLIGRTQPITINYSSQEFQFEPYTVKLDMMKASIEIYGGTDVNSYIHPHISESGIICWGNIGSLVYRLAAELDLYGLYQLIHQFLATYNPDDAYQRIERWDPDWIDDDEDSPWCEFCEESGHETSECEYCWWCEHCEDYVDHPEDECPNYREESDEEISEPIASAV